jgi:hypothetical protein
MRIIAEKYITGLNQRVPGIKYAHTMFVPFCAIEVISGEQLWIR